MTKEDVVQIYDKDICRIWPFRYRYDTTKNGIKVGYYTLDDNTFTSGDKYPDNKCFCPGRQECAPDGIQDIGPCHFGKLLLVNLYYSSFSYHLTIW